MVTFVHPEGYDLFKVSADTGLNNFLQMINDADWQVVLYLCTVMDKVLVVIYHISHGFLTQLLKPIVKL